MNINDIINDDLIQDEPNLWSLKIHNEFDYSDGKASEKYLESVLRNTTNLNSNSSELENHIKDWPSEYHLSTKRAQLFTGFNFDSSLQVLEVGSGCGAITRYLGETFSSVVSIEGSIKRARLAKLRTADLDSVKIICAPFQKIKFKKKFDIIFCIGVFEYSASFVPGKNPYESVLSYFSDILNPNGIVVIAIENQFGLKYFNSSREDHTCRLYEGLEGYQLHYNKVKTFGKYELEKYLNKYFSSIKFYYPYPDYKLPNCIFSEQFLSSSRAGELVSQIKSRDYFGELNNLWDESLVYLELSKNGMLPFFSNSFLIVAGKNEIQGASFDQLAVLVSDKRIYKFKTHTRIFMANGGEIKVSKKPCSGESLVNIDKLTLTESNSNWEDSSSLQTIVYKNCMSQEMNLSEMFKICRKWVEYLNGESEYINDVKYLDGKYIDCIWSNIYLNNNGISIIDQEWIWKEKIKLNVLIIRSIYTFLYRIKNTKYLSSVIKLKNLKKLISIIAESMGVELYKSDFTEFIKLESEFQSLVFGSEKKYNRLKLRWILFNQTSFYFIRKIRKYFDRSGIFIRIKNRFTFTI